MKVSDFEARISETPRWYAVFRVKKVPDWAKGRVLVGDELAWYGGWTLRLLREPANYDIGPSFIEFVEYRQIAGLD